MLLTASNDGKHATNDTSTQFNTLSLLSTTAVSVYAAAELFIGTAVSTLVVLERWHAGDAATRSSSSML